jgi:hypothetical protein
MLGGRSFFNFQLFFYQNSQERKLIAEKIPSSGNSALPTGKSFSEALIYFSINPKYSIALLGRFPLIIHKNYISRTLVERQLYTDCFAYLAQMNVAIIMYNIFTFS